MEIARCKDQKSSTLEEFYSEMSKQYEIGETMLSLISRLRSIPGKRKVWGLTSHERLCLLARNSSKSPRLVTFIGLDRRNYFIEYLMPNPISPWPQAYVKGEARSEDQAVEMIIQAMNECGGWKNAR